MSEPSINRGARSSAPARRTISLVCVVCTVFSVPCATASQILSYSDVTLTATSEAPGVSTFQRDSKTLPPGAPGLATVLDQPQSWGRFPTSESALPRGFMSSVIASNSFAGVGLSGIQALGSDAYTDAMLEQTITNIGDEDCALFLDYEIPRLDVAILGNRFINAQFSAYAAAAYKIAHYDAEGDLLRLGSAFHYDVRVSQLGSGGNTFIHRSDDLLADQGVGQAYVDGAVEGVRYDAFEESRFVALLRPGDRLEVRYSLYTEVENAFGVDEVGFQALIGDPSNLGGGLRYRIGALNAVPEPSSMALCGLGVASFAVLAFRKRRGRRRA